MGIEPVAIIVTILAAVLVIFVIIIAIIIVVVVFIRRKSSRAGTANDEIHDEIPDVTKRQDLQQVTDIVLTDSNPAASHLPTSFKEMELTQNYAYVTMHTRVEPNSHRESMQLPTVGIQLIHQTMLSCNNSVVFCSCCFLQTRIKIVISVVL